MQVPRMELLWGCRYFCFWSQYRCWVQMSPRPTKPETNYHSHTCRFILGCKRPPGDMILSNPTTYSRFYYTRPTNNNSAFMHSTGSTDEDGYIVLWRPVELAASAMAPMNEWLLFRLRWITLPYLSQLVIRCHPTILSISCMVRTLMEDNNVTGL